MKEFFRSTRSRFMFALAVLALFAAVFTSDIQAQSGSKQAGSASKATASGGSGNSKTAMEGYCSVCVLNLKKWVAGKAEFKSTFDGQHYYFPGAEQKATFDADPVKYVPVLGGDCVVAYKKMGKRVPGNIRFAAFHDNRLFLFSSEMARKEFLSAPEGFADADLALGGKCSVCKVEMHKDVDGKADVAVVYQGLRYLFPGTDQRDMFIANPEKYAVSKQANQSGGSGRGVTTGSSKK